MLIFKPSESGRFETDRPLLRYIFTCAIYTIYKSELFFQSNPIKKYILAVLQQCVMLMLTTAKILIGCQLLNCRLQ